MRASIVRKIKSAPQDPGIYVFRTKNKVLYVGKAANLRARLKSYLKIIDLKTKALHVEADRLDLIPLRSEIEALIEESRLIKKLNPKYNVLWRDDKSYHYIYFTKEDFPKVFLGHARPKKSMEPFARIGPYTDGSALRLVMKLLRRQFPYCTCARSHLRDCLNAQIGRCLGYCCKKTQLVIANEVKQSYKDISKNNQGEIAAVASLPRNDKQKEYAKNIKKIKMVLRGQSKRLLQTLKDGKERIALQNIFQHQPYIYASTTVEKKNPEGNRIEAYDISHFAGKEAVGAMTVLVKKDGLWQPDKNSYRKFKIKLAPKSDDPRAIAEVLERRLHHPEWPYPDLIIIDGGITQLSAARKVISKFQNPSIQKIKITAFPKPQKKLIGWPDAPEEIIKLAERAIYQTHNFVIRYHRQVRRKEFLN